MKYRHGFHAGNFADVHKHVALCALLRAMQRKDKAFLYLDTHAGAGRYDLGPASGRRGADTATGIAALMECGDTPAAQPHAQELKDYLAAVTALRSTPGNANGYPGSPWLAAYWLRAQDRGICCEILPAECRALERGLQNMHSMQIECIDGYRQLPAALPPRERRCLVLIDPPYEEPTELDHALQATLLCLQRLANTVIALWYPIKDERTLIPWLERVERQISAPTLSLQLWVHPRDSRVGLNGSGLLIFNPPYQFEQHAIVWQNELLPLLDKAAQGGSAVRTLVHAADVKHAGT